jgi:PAS domain S-box-containing protein
LHRAARTSMNTLTVADSPPSLPTRHADAATSKLDALSRLAGPARSMLILVIGMSTLEGLWLWHAGTAGGLVLAAVSTSLAAAIGFVVLGHRGARDLARARAEVDAQAAELAHLRTLWQALPAGAVVHASDGRIVDANPAASALLGLTADQLLGRTSMDPRWRALDEDGHTLTGENHPAMRTLRTGEPCHHQVMGIALPDGTRRWLRVQSWPVAPTSSHTALAVVASFVDVTEQRAQRRLLELTIDASGLGTWEEDLVTGAARYNMRWFTMLGEDPDPWPAHRCTWEARVHPDDLPRVAIEMERHLLDPSRPYRVEYRMRHRRGDWVWVLAAGSVVERDPGNRPLRVAGIHIEITAGRSQDPARWTRHPPAGRSREQALSRATPSAPSVLRPRHPLWDALERPDGLIVHYQPMLDLRSERWVGLEARAMWPHAVQGLVSAEGVGMALDREALLPRIAGRLVERAAGDLAFLRQQHGDKAPSSVAFDVHAVQVHDSTFCDDLRRAIVRFDLPRGALQVDVREALALDDRSAAVTLEALHAFGASLCLDAFGSGRASLAALDGLPFSAVKIDPSFVQGLADDRYRQAMVSAICRLAEALGQAVIADGVTSLVDLQALPAMGCHLAMGPAVGQPLDITALHQRLQTPAMASLSLH